MPTQSKLMVEQSKEHFLWSSCHQSFYVQNHTWSIPDNNE